jgi:hypothetical protein
MNVSLTDEIVSAIHEKVSNELYSGSSLLARLGLWLQDAHLQRFGLDCLRCFPVATMLPV